MAKNKQIINGPHAIFIGKGIMLTGVDNILTGLSGHVVRVTP